ncbi:RNA-guided endonuclease InsQ/TnpB family protein [Clostridium sp. MT-14]|uniref:RNA-guided endonuclease InsQ/TnpB family protein n=1 Tax=Clostridium sp. MT-14 TaxID=3348360 RepID=UPI0035F4657F
MKVNRAEQIQINKNHPMWHIIDQFSFYSKNLYNYANYIIRQEYINNHNYIKYSQMAKDLKTTEPYKQLMSQASQCTLQVLDRCWKSFFNGMKQYKKSPDKFLGRPKLPKYKKKDGRFPWFLKNNQIYFENGYLWFKLKVFNGYKFKTHLTDKDRIISIRFIPRGCIYVLEIVYEKEIHDKVEIESKRIISIDLGVNNFATITNNIGKQPIIINGRGIKSINQFYNKRRAKIQSILKKINNKDWSNQLNRITLKRNNRIKNFMHHASKYVIDYCIKNNVDTIVIGKNDGWKQESVLRDKVNQHFIGIPYELFIQMLQYKGEDNNIKVIESKESYTSGTSFLDNELPIKENYNKNRRIVRGLFQSNKGILINSDVNGSLQIMKKVFSDAIKYGYGIEGCLTPIVIDVVKLVA